MSFMASRRDDFSGIHHIWSKGGKKSIDGVKTHTGLLENLGKGVLHDIGSNVYLCNVSLMFKQQRHRGKTLWGAVIKCLDCLVLASITIREAATIVLKSL